MSNPTVARTDPTARAAHAGFLISMWGKGLLGLSQIIGGIALGLAPAGSLPALVQALARFELIEDPGDRFALWLDTLSQSMPASGSAFYTIYLIIHGALNLGLVLALLAGLRWAYPASIAVLALFILYQLWKFSHAADPAMLLLSAIDMVVIVLIWREWHHQTADDRKEPA